MNLKILFAFILQLLRSFIRPTKTPQVTATMEVTAIAAVEDTSRRKPSRFTPSQQLLSHRLFIDCELKSRELNRQELKLNSQSETPYGYSS